MSPWFIFIAAFSSLMAIVFASAGVWLVAIVCAGNAVWAIRRGLQNEANEGEEVNMAIVRGLRVAGLVTTYVVGVIVLSRIGLPLIYALPFAVVTIGALFAFSAAMKNVGKRSHTTAS